MSIKKKQEIERIIQESKKYPTPNFLISIRSNQSDFLRYAIIIPKKHVKNSVSRSRIRRLLREVLIAESSRLRGNDVLCLVRKPLEAKYLNFHTVYKELKSILEKSESRN